MQAPPGTQPAVTAFVLAQLRSLSNEADRVERMGLGARRRSRGRPAAEDRLSQIPRWRADDLFECAGGPTESWPGEWLG